MTEAEMWKKMRSHLKEVHMTRIENAASFGTPDVNLGFNGRDYWLELKVERKMQGIYAAELRPTQLAWVIARLRVAKNIFFFTFREGTDLWSLYDAKSALMQLQPHMSKSYIRFGDVVPIYHDHAPWDLLTDYLQSFIEK